MDRRSFLDNKSVGIHQNLSFLLKGLEFRGMFLLVKRVIIPIRT